MLELAKKKKKSVQVHLAIQRVPGCFSLNYHVYQKYKFIHDLNRQTINGTVDDHDKSKTQGASLPGGCGKKKNAWT